MWLSPHWPPIREAEVEAEPLALWGLGKYQVLLRPAACSGALLFLLEVVRKRLGPLYEFEVVVDMQRRCSPEDTAVYPEFASESPLCASCRAGASQP